MAIVHTTQNRLPSLLVGNDVGRKQSQIIENRKKFNQITTDAIHKLSTFSNPVFFYDFTNPTNISFWEPNTFSDSIVNTFWDPSAFSYPTYAIFLESLANSSSYFLHSWFSHYSRRKRKSNPSETTIFSVTYIDSPTFRWHLETMGLPLVIFIG